MSDSEARPAESERAGAILLVDDDEPTLRSIARTLRPERMREIVISSDSRTVMGVIERRSIAVVLLDLMMPHVGGEQLLEQITSRYPDVSVILVTGEDDVDTAVRCMKRGATDYLVKPVDPDRLVTTVHRALEQNALRHEATHLRQQFLAEAPEPSEVFREIVTGDPAMKRLFSYIEAVSRGSQPALITGETGTGKELLARALHDASDRPGPFVAVNVAGLDDTSFSDTLFGHRAGAFTGAVEVRGGIIEAAGHGTLFLDEIGDLTEASQVKLLRLLQEREYFPLGSDSPRTMHARVVAATHQGPEKLRNDLYYRLRLYHAHIPPLRERLGDLSLLVDRFLTAAAEDLQKPRPEVSPELFFHLENHNFPGNVRELQAMVFDAVARTEEPVIPVDVFLEPIGSLRREDVEPAPSEADNLRLPFPLPSLNALERGAIAEALRRVGGNQSAAARMLGISRAKIARKMSNQESGESDD